MKPRLAGWSLLATLLLAPSFASVASAKRPEKVVVISLGDDSRSAGLLQRGLEAKLGESSDLEIIPASALAGNLGKGPTLGKLETDPAIHKEATAAISDAEAAYYEDRLPAALGQLTTVEVSYRRAEYVEVEDWIELYLWRTAVFLAMEDNVQAELEAKKALTLSPDLEVDLSVFRPSVGELIEKVRQQGLPMIRVRIDGLPQGAQIRVDDRPVEANFRVPVGRHYLVVEADGYKRFARSFESSRSIALAAGLSLVVPFDMEIGLVDMALGKGTRGETYLKSIAKQFDADRVVVVASVTAPAPAVRAAIWDEKGKQPVNLSAPLASSDRGRFELVKWAAEALSGDASHAVAKQHDTSDNGKNDKKDDKKDNRVGFGSLDKKNEKTHRKKTGQARIPREPSAWVFEARAGAAVFSRNRTLSSASGPGYDISVFGAGPGVSGGFRKGMIVGDLDVAWLSYDISKVEVNHPSQGNLVKVGGGTTLRTRLGGGVLYEFGPGGGARPGVMGTLGVTYESHAAQDLEDAGSRVGLFTSYTRTAIDARVIGRYPVQVGEQTITLQAGGEIVPYTNWTEEPAGSLGQSPKPSLAFGWRAGVLWAPVEKWIIGVDYVGETRSVSFSGQGTLPTSPLLDSASTSETLHGVLALVHREF